MFIELIVYLWLSCLFQLGHFCLVIQTCIKWLLINFQSISSSFEAAHTATITSLYCFHVSCLLICFSRWPKLASFTRLQGTAPTSPCVSSASKSWRAGSRRTTHSKIITSLYSWITNASKKDGGCMQHPFFINLSSSLFI